MMRTEASIDAINTLACSDDRPVKIEGDPGQRTSCPCLEGDVAKQRAQPLLTVPTDVLQPAREGSLAGQATKACKATGEWIEAELVGMGETRTTEQHVPDRPHRHPERAVIAVELSIGEDLADPVQPTFGSKEASEELERRPGGRRLLGELDREQTLDAGPQNLIL